MKKRIIYFIVALLFLITALSIRLSRYYIIACDTYAENGIKGTLTNEINKKLSEKLILDKIKYDDISKIKYIEDGYISSIEIDTVKINLIANELSSELYNCIQNSKNSFGIPMGNMFGIGYLSGKGPEISVTIVPVGSVAYEITSELLSGGINQTLHRISIRLDTVISCLTPFNESCISISTTIAIAETLIIGNVPNIISPTWR